MFLQDDEIQNDMCKMLSIFFGLNVNLMAKYKMITILLQ